MFIHARRRIFLLASLLCAAAASAQQAGPSTATTAPAAPRAGRIVLDVVVTAKSGAPVGGLQRQDFTLLDNKVPQTLASFQAVAGREAPVEVTVVIDAANAVYRTVGFDRDEIDKFLRTNEDLPHPTALSAVTDTGTQVQKGFSTNGTVLANSLEQFTIGLRTVPDSTGFQGANERFQLSLESLRNLLAAEAPRPGRKVLLWISPGWPLLTGPRIRLDDKDQQRLFAQVVDLSTQLLQSHATLYSIDPLGTADIGTATFYWREFIKGVSKPSQIQAANLALPVLATQSGGIAFNSNNDVSAELQKCFVDIGTYYELSFDPPPASGPHQYHQLEVRVAKPGLTARTRQGYYSQP